jgi:replicative DNA helicase
LIEQTILHNLISNEDFSRKVLPHIQPEYFHDRSERIAFEVIRDYVNKYNKSPELQAVKIEIDNRRDLTEETAKGCQVIVDTYDSKKLELDWLVNVAEKFCQDKAIENGLYKAMSIMENKKGNTLGRGAIPQILSDALAVSFDSHIGHDYFEDWEARHSFFHEDHVRIPFDLEILNKITKGGLIRKTLNILMGGVGFGKSLFMCHMAAANLVKGFNVLYITMEMAEQLIAERIDANLMDVALNDLVKLDKVAFHNKIKKIWDKTPGKLVIQEYNEGAAGADNFRHLLNELKLKKKFIPDIIYIDYLNICKSSRIKLTGDVGLYQYVQAIAQEVRGLAKEFNVPIVSATQFNREGFKSSEPEMHHISESFGLAAAADIILAIVRNEELDALKQVFIKQIKNRYNRPDYYRRFHLGLDLEKMRLFDVSADIKPEKEDIPVMDAGTMASKGLFAGIK